MKTVLILLAPALIVSTHDKRMPMVVAKIMSQKKLPQIDQRGVNSLIQALR